MLLPKIFLINAEYFYHHIAVVLNIRKVREEIKPCCALSPEFDLHGSKERRPCFNYLRGSLLPLLFYFQDFCKFFINCQSLPFLPNLDFMLQICSFPWLLPLWVSPFSKPGFQGVASPPGMRCLLFALLPSSRGSVCSAVQFCTSRSFFYFIFSWGLCGEWSVGLLHRT